MPLKFGFLFNEVSKLVSTKTLLLKHNLPFQGKHVSVPAEESSLETDIPLNLADRNRSNFCDLRLQCPSRSPEMASDLGDKTK